ncbi:hypothetical protein [Paenibacillus sp.]|uniref:hypothetical protein n=1 Tax=Paenibacillus sp. TaxID=58172 RepID=UPI0034645F14
MPETRDWQEDWQLMLDVFKGNSTREVIARHWLQQHQKKSELYNELKEQYTTEKKRADEATERERRLLELLDRILDKTDGYSAYSNEAYIHSWIREVQRTLYGDDSHEGNR